MKLALTPSILSILLAAEWVAAEEFSYDPQNPLGPANWDQVEVDGNACGGDKQSGIDIPTQPCSAYDAYALRPGNCTIGHLTFKLSDHSIQASYPTDGSCQPPVMRIPGQDGVSWEASQFHFHAGSDHAIDGVSFGADFHLVHKEVGGTRLAVIGMFVNPGSPTNTGVFDDVLTGWEAAASQTRQQCNLDTNDVAAPDATHAFNPYSILPTGYSMYTYSGSLTTPPCSEIVSWNVVDKPLQISVRDYRRLTSLILDFVSPDTCMPGTVASPSGSTGRPFSPLNGRTITRHCPAGAPPTVTAPTRSPSGPICVGAKNTCTIPESGRQGVYVSRRRAGGRCQETCYAKAQGLALLNHPSGSYKCGKCPSKKQ
jgi:carbonic anhydrase